MKKYNHMMDVAFTVVSEEEDPYELTIEELIDGMDRRLESLRKQHSYEAREAFGHCDTYIEERE